MACGIQFTTGYELIAVVEDLKTLRSTAAVLIFADELNGTRLFEVISMIEVPDGR